MVMMKFLSEEFDGTELCCECGMEFDFNIVPQKGIDIVCPHCGAVQHPCSLCDSGVDCSKGCKVNIINSLIEYNKEM